MTNGEVFFKIFPCLEQDEQWPNILWWTDEKGKRQLLGDVYDSYFWDEEFNGLNNKNKIWNRILFKILGLFTDRKKRHEK